MNSYSLEHLIKAKKMQGGLGLVNCDVVPSHLWGERSRKRIEDGVF